MSTPDADPATATAAEPPTERGFGRDVAVLTLVRMVGVAAGFATSIVTARWLGPDELGLAGVALTVGTIAALVGNSGLNIASIYYLGRRPDDRQAITNRAFTLGLAGALIAAALVFLAAALLRGILTDGGLGLVIAAALLAGGIVGYELNGSLLLGLELRKRYVVTQVIEGVGSLVTAIVIVVLLAPTATGYVLSAAVAFVAAAAYAITIAHRAVGGRMLAFDRQFTGEALAMGLRGQVGNVLQFLNLRLDLIIVPWLLDLHAAGVYLIAVRMSEVVTQVASSASAFLFPAVSRSNLTSTALTERTIRITLIVVGLLGVAIVVLAEPLLRVFFGSQYVAGSSAVRITMIAMIPLAVTRVLAGDLKGRGRAGLVSIAAGVALTVSVGFDLLLIPVFGIDGAAAASIAAYGAGALILLVAYRSTTGSSLRQLVPTLADVRSLASLSRRAGRVVVGAIRDSR